MPVCTRKWPYLNHFSDLFAQTEPVAYLQDHQGFQIDFHEIEGKNQEPVYTTRHFYPDHFSGLFVQIGSVLHVQDYLRIYIN